MVILTGSAKRRWSVNQKDITVLQPVAQKRFALCYRTVVCLSCLSVTLVYCSQTVRWIRIPTWYGGRPRPKWHCVKWGPSCPGKGAQQPPTFRPTLLWYVSATAELLSCFVSGHNAISSSDDRHHSTPLSAEPTAVDESLWRRRVSLTRRYVLVSRSAVHR